MPHEPPRGGKGWNGPRLSVVGVQGPAWAFRDEQEVFACV